MKISMTFTKDEAQKIFGQAITEKLLPGSQLRVTEVTWHSYGDRVEVEATDDPPPAEAGAA